MEIKIEQRYVIRYHVRHRPSAAETIRNLKKVYGDDGLQWRQVTCLLCIYCIVNKPDFSV